MIENIDVSSLPPFGDYENISDLAIINYLYAPNGSGKTSISNLVNSNREKVRWREGRIHPVRVFNRDYLRNAFASPEGEPGIFLLGEDAGSSIQEIDRLQKDIEGYDSRIEGKESAIQSKYEKNKDEDTRFTEFIWELGKSVPEIIKDNVVGFKKRDSCRRYSLGAIDSDDLAEVDTIDELSKRAEVIYSENCDTFENVPSVPAFPGDVKNISDLLLKPLTSSAETEISRKVQELGNFDWVVDGVKYVSGEKCCPFCFQNLPDELVDQISGLTDENYKRSIDFLVSSKESLNYFLKSIEDFIKNNRTVFEEFKQSSLKMALFSIVSQVELFISKIEQKLDHPSDMIETSWVDNLDDIQLMLDNLNKEIDRHNELVNSSAELRKNFSSEVWKSFVSGEVTRRYDDYINSKRSTDEQIARMEESLADFKRNRTQLISKLETIKRSLRSSEAIAARINNMLLMCNFHSFEVSIADSESGGYVITREGGLPADVESLSEGERTFITFLYFLQSLEGEQPENDNKSVVVIDDPISSLDSDVMFTVSMLIRELTKKVEAGVHRNVEQVLIMTHNTRFHNEVCYRHNSSYSDKYCFYRIIKKSPDPNIIERVGPNNPIRTSYQELWDQVSKATSDKSASYPWLPNIMRRIIESYFSTLGGENNLYEIGSEMDFEEKILHNSLIAWSHSGSHTIMDDDAINLQSHNNEKWIDAFQAVFEKTGNTSHYNVMMQNANKFNNR